MGKDMGAHVSPWVPMGKNMGVPMGKVIGAHGRPWVLMGTTWPLSHGPTHGVPWGPMGKEMGAHGSPWEPVGGEIEHKPAGLLL